MHVHLISSFPVSQNQIDTANFEYVGFFYLQGFPVAVVCILACIGACFE